MLSDTHGDILADKVNGHIQGNLLVFQDALEVQMQNLAFGGMTLHVFDNDGLRLTAELQRQDARVEGLLLHLMLEPIVPKHQRSGILAAAIQDCGHLATST